MFAVSPCPRVGLLASKAGVKPLQIQGHLTIAARFQVPICVGCTPYFLDNSASVISSRIASSATLALNSGEWFFRFFISDRLFRHAIHLNHWSEIPCPPWSRGGLFSVDRNRRGAIYSQYHQNDAYQYHGQGQDLPHRQPPIAKMQRVPDWISATDELRIRLTE